MNCSHCLSVSIIFCLSGLILSNVIGFNLIAPPGYVPAGYRGLLQHGFIKKEALTHVFKKGIKMSVPMEGKL